MTTALDHRKKCWSGRRKEGEEGERERERERREGTGGKKTSEEGADCNCHLRPSVTAAAELLTPTATFK